MALIQTGGGITDIRGSIGGTTFSRSAAGLIARTRRKPINKNSTRQNSARAALSICGTHWNQTITEAHRAAWRDFAANSPTTNKLGQAINISGYSAFARLQTLRLQSALEIPTVAPTAYGAAAETPLVITASAATQEITFADPVSGFDKDVDDSYLVIFLSQPQSSGRVGNPKGFQWRTKITGSSGAPVTFPWTLGHLYTFLEGHRLFVRAVHIDADNRVSAATFANCVAGA